MSIPVLVFIICQVLRLEVMGCRFGIGTAVDRLRAAIVESTLRWSFRTSRQPRFGTGQGSTCAFCTTLQRGHKIGRLGRWEWRRHGEYVMEISWNVLQCDGIIGWEIACKVWWDWRKSMNIRSYKCHMIVHRWWDSRCLCGASRVRMAMRWVARSS